MPNACGYMVHPHACREHSLSSSPTEQPFVSSPRVWGTRGHNLQKGPSRRFIPTWVGNTNSFCRNFFRFPVHPHAGGELASGKQDWTNSHGSSPRGWGTPAHQQTASQAKRFIPTPVGNTPSSPPTKAAGTVHPHACGEHAVW